MLGRSRGSAAATFGAVAALALLLVGCASAGGDDGGGAGAVVERVVDGDTIRVQVDGEPDTVRLIGIDTPESVAPNQPVECFGPEASDRLAELLPPGEPVTIETDPSQDERDRFDRLLGYVYAEDGDRSANEVLVASGHARVFVFDDTPFREAEDFMAAEAEARDAGRGLWGACGSAGEEAPVAPVEGGACDPNYTPCVPPPPPDVDCSAIDGPVTVTGVDRHRLDGDGDGVACD